MINVAGLTIGALSDKVLDDNYFMNELTDIDYLIALVREEYIFTDAQLGMLMHDLFWEIGNRS